MLSDIRSELTSDFGFSQTTALEKSYLTKLINDALAEVYRDNELYMSDREQLFDVGVDNQIITLPSNVDKILAVRRYDSRTKVTLQDMRPRYRSMAWAAPYTEYPYLQWRFKNRACLKREFLDVSPFTYTVNQPVAGGFTLKITGRTETAARVSESIVFSGTESAKVGSVPFVEYFAMLKNRTVAEDIIVTDGEGNEVAVIPNNELRISYPYYQILDRNETISASTFLVEVLYKLQQAPLVEDSDSFLDDIYDKVIYWQTAAAYYAKKSGDDSITRSVGYAAKAAQVLAAINQSYMRNSTAEVIYEPVVGARVMTAVRYGAYSVSGASGTY